MAEEKNITVKEILNEKQLVDVVGGTLQETRDDIDYVTKYTGIKFRGNDSEKRKKLRALLVEGKIQLRDHGGFESNQYFVLDDDGNLAYETDREHALYYAVMNIRRQRGI